MKHLHIPERFRKTKSGARTRCNHCGKNFTDKCGKTGMRIHTCNHPESHRFQSQVYDPIKKRMVHANTWPKELRDFQEFWRLHLELVSNQDNVVILDDKPALLTACMKMYSEWINDIGVPTYEKKNNSAHYTRGEMRHLKNLKEALASKDINSDLLSITEFSKNHVGAIYDYLTDRFSNKSFNHQLATYRRFFNYLISKDYPIKNYWSDVKKLPTKANTEMVTLEEFELLCSIVTPEAGIKLKSKKEKGKLKVFRSHLYTDYLIDGWKFELYTGCRYEEIQELRVRNVFEDHIAAKDHKVSKLKNEDVVRLIPMIDELRDLTSKLAENLDLDDYLIAPNEKDRVKVTRMLSQAFTHYWGQVSERKGITFYSLKNSYATAMVKLFGNKTNLHRDFNTTMKNYVDELELVKTFNVKLYG